MRLEQGWGGSGLGGVMDISNMICSSRRCGWDGGIKYIWSVVGMVALLYMKGWVGTPVVDRHAALFRVTRWWLCTVLRPSRRPVDGQTERQVGRKVDRQAFPSNNYFLLVGRAAKVVEGIYKV